MLSYPSLYFKNYHKITIGGMLFDKNHLTVLKIKEESCP